VITSVVDDNVGNNVGNNVLRKDGLIVVELFISVLLLLLLLSSFICKDGSADGSSVVDDGCRDDGCLDVDDNSLLIITECNIVGINDGENNNIDDEHVLGLESD
jgi:hypothetical protein